MRGSSAVVNLAGTPISTRWSPEVCDRVGSLCFDLYSCSHVAALSLIRHPCLQIKQDIKQSRLNVTSKVKYLQLKT